jgi:AraC-like DNA-binding protein
MTSSDNKLQALRATTRAVAAPDRFEAWRESVQGLFDVEPVSPSEFLVDTATWHFEELLVIQAQHSARRQNRTERSIRTEPVDHYRVLLQHQGSLRLDEDGRRLLVEPGQVVISDMARPEVFDTDAGASTIVIVPRDVLDRASPRPLDLHGTVAKGPAGALLAEHLVRLTRDASLLDRREAAPLARATVHMIAAAFSSALAADETVLSSGATLLRQACRFIDEHLSEPDFSVQDLCVRFNVSRATLYRLFEPLGGVSRYVLERRLLNAHDHLSAADRVRHLARVAEAHGFRDTTHFSKSFRRMFGYSPSEVGLQAQATVPVHAIDGEPPAVVREWLRKLRA